VSRRVEEDRERTEQGHEGGEGDRTDDERPAAQVPDVNHGVKDSHG